MKKEFRLEYLPQLPRLKLGIYAIPMGTYDVQMRLGLWGPAYKIHDQERLGLVRDLLPLLSGKFTAKEILGKLKRYDSKDVISTLELLYSRGFIEEAMTPDFVSISLDEWKRYTHSLSAWPLEFSNQNYQ